MKNQLKNMSLLVKDAVISASNFMIIGTLNTHPLELVKDASACNFWYRHTLKDSVFSVCMIFCINFWCLKLLTNSYLH